MNKGVEILIARLKSNPEEFEYGERFGKYGEMMAEISGGSDRVRRTNDPVDPMYFLTAEERAALVAAWNERMREGFARGVMATLVADPKPKEETHIYPQGLVSSSNIAQQQAAYNQALRDSMAQLKKEVAVEQARSAYQNQVTGGLGAMLGNSSIDPRKLFK